MKSYDKDSHVSNIKDFLEIVEVPVEPLPCSKEQVIEYVKVPKFVAKVHDVACNAGLPQFQDMYIKGFLGKVSLGTMLTELQKLKKEFYEQIRAFITTYLPDGIRPIKLAVDVARQIKYYREIIKCLARVVSQIRELIADYLKEITEFINDLNQMMDRLREELYYITEELKNIPTETIAVIFGTTLEQLHFEDAFDLIEQVREFEADLETLKAEIDATEQLLNEWPTSTLEQLKLIAEENGLDDILNILNSHPKDEAYLIIVDKCQEQKAKYDQGQQALQTLRENRDYKNAEEIKNELDQALSSAMQLQNSVTMPDFPTNDVQELLDYQDQILDNINGGSGGGGIIGGSNMTYLVDSLNIIEQTQLVENSGEVISTNDSFFRYWITNQTPTDDDLKGYNKVYYPGHLFEPFQEGQELKLIDLEGPGMIFPDLFGFVKVNMHTDELPTNSVLITIKRDGKTISEKRVHGYSPFGKPLVRLDADAPFLPAPINDNAHFMQEIILKPLEGENGQLLPILFKEKFEIIVKKETNLHFNYDFNVYIGCKFIKMIKEGI